MAKTTAKPSGVKRYFRGSLEKDHRRKHAADGERRNKRRHGNSGGTVQGGFRQGPALLRQ